MKPIRKLTLALLAPFLLLTIGSTSCVRLVAEARITVAKGAIPPEFGKTKGTLLVVRSDASGYNAFLNRNFGAYLGEYKFVNAADLAAGDHADVKRYPYAFDFELEQHAVTGSDGRMRDITVRRFYILDRATDKHYPAKITSSFYSKVMKAYITNLNKELVAARQ